MHVHERVKAGTGYTDRLNYHLDRMAANTGMTCILRDTAKRHKAVDVPASTTPRGHPRPCKGQTKALSPTLDNAPILHITPLTSANSTF